MATSPTTNTWLARRRPADRDAHARARALAPAGTGIHAPQLLDQPRLDRFHGEPAHRHRTDVGDHHESLARHIQCVCRLHVAGEHEHDLIAGTDAVAGVGRAESGRLEFRGGAAEHVQAEDLEGVAVQAVARQRMARTESRSARESSPPRSVSRGSGEGRPGMVTPMRCSASTDESSATPRCGSPPRSSTSKYWSATEGS
jgi:hypothetical protein